MTIEEARESKYTENNSDTINVFMYLLDPGEFESENSIELASPRVHGDIKKPYVTIIADNFDGGMTGE
ncbi:hypothetical protein K7I15_00120 [Marinobacter shengliensis]|nr:hypothetical protein [Marinobacter shengliensis]